MLQTLLAAAFVSSLVCSRLARPFPRFDALAPNFSFSCLSANSLWTQKFKKNLMLESRKLKQPPTQIFSDVFQKGSTIKKLVTNNTQQFCQNKWKNYANKVSHTFTFYTSQKIYLANPLRATGHDSRLKVFRQEEMVMRLYLIVKNKVSFKKIRMRSHRLLVSKKKLPPFGWNYSFSSTYLDSTYSYPDLCENIFPHTQFSRLIHCINFP